MDLNEILVRAYEMGLELLKEKHSFPADEISHIFSNYHGSPIPFNRHGFDSLEALLENSEFFERCEDSSEFRCTPKENYKYQYDWPPLKGIYAVDSDIEERGLFELIEKLYAIGERLHKDEEKLSFSPQEINDAYRAQYGKPIPHRDLGFRTLVEIFEESETRFVFCAETNGFKCRRKKTSRLVAVEGKKLDEDDQEEMIKKEQAHGEEISRNDEKEIEGVKKKLEEREKEAMEESPDASLDSNDQIRAHQISIKKLRKRKRACTKPGATPLPLESGMSSEARVRSPSLPSKRKWKPVHSGEVEQVIKSTDCSVGILPAAPSMVDSEVAKNHAENHLERIAERISHCLDNLPRGETHQNGIFPTFQRIYKEKLSEMTRREAFNNCMGAFEELAKVDDKKFTMKKNAGGVWIFKKKAEIKEESAKEDDERSIKEEPGEMASPDPLTPSDDVEAEVAPVVREIPASVGGKLEASTSIMPQGAPQIALSLDCAPLSASNPEIPGIPPISAPPPVGPDEMAWILAAFSEIEQKQSPTQKVEDQKIAEENKGEAAVDVKEEEVCDVFLSPLKSNVLPLAESLQDEPQMHKSPPAMATKASPTAPSMRPAPPLLPPPCLSNDPPLPSASTALYPGKKEVPVATMISSLIDRIIVCIQPFEEWVKLDDVGFGILYGMEMKELCETAFGTDETFVKLADAGRDKFEMRLTPGDWFIKKTSCASSSSSHRTRTNSPKTNRRRTIDQMRSISREMNSIRSRSRDRVPEPSPKSRGTKRTGGRHETEAVAKPVGEFRTSKALSDRSSAPMASTDMPNRLILRPEGPQIASGAWVRAPITPISAPPSNIAPVLFNTLMGKLRMQTPSLSDQRIGEWTRPPPKTVCTPNGVYKMIHRMINPTTNSTALPPPINPLLVAPGTSRLLPDTVAGTSRRNPVPTCQPLQFMNDPRLAAAPIPLRPPLMRLMALPPPPYPLFMSDPRLRDFAYRIRHLLENMGGFGSLQYVEAAYYAAFRSALHNDFFLICPEGTSLFILTDISHGEIVVDQGEGGQISFRLEYNR